MVPGQSFTMPSSVHPNECYCAKCTGIDTSVAPKDRAGPSGTKRKTVDSSKATKQLKLTDYDVKPAKFSKRQYKDPVFKQLSFSQRKLIITGI